MNHRTTLPKTNSSPLKMGHPKRETIVFRPWMFSGYFSFGEGIFSKDLPGIAKSFGMEAAGKTQRNHESVIKHWVPQHTAIVARAFVWPRDPQKSLACANFTADFLRSKKGSQLRPKNVQNICIVFVVLGSAEGPRNTFRTRDLQQGWKQGKDLQQGSKQPNDFPSLNHEFQIMA